MLATSIGILEWWLEFFLDFFLNSIGRTPSGCWPSTSWLNYASRPKFATWWPSSSPSSSATSSRSCPRSWRCTCWASWPHVTWRAPHKPAAAGGSWPRTTFSGGRSAGRPVSTTSRIRWTSAACADPLTSPLPAMACPARRRLITSQRPSSLLPRGR